MATKDRGLEQTRFSQWPTSEMAQFYREEGTPLIFFASCHFIAIFNLFSRAFEFVKVDRF